MRTMMPKKTESIGMSPLLAVLDGVVKIVVDQVAAPGVEIAQVQAAPQAEPDANPRPGSCE